MAEEKTYLELSQDTGSAHKFYEVIVDGASVSIRYGRIGTNGTKKVHDQGTSDKALAFAQKKLNEKKKKGYTEAQMGVRKKRSVTRREITSQASTIKTGAPLLWKFSSGTAAFGVFVDDDLCWVGNQAGRVIAVDHDGQVVQQFKLPDGVKCVVADDGWLYAGCDNGNVYDLTGKAPHVAYEIADDIDIYWLDIKDGVMGVSDANGNVVIVNHEEESQWTQKSDGDSGWMVRCDEIGVYHGYNGGVTMYDWEDGSVLWKAKTQSQVLFGWQEESTVYAGCSDKKVYQFSKKGEPGNVYKADGTVYSCAATEDGKFVFAGDNSSTIYCWNEKGDLVWKFATECGSAYSMQYHNDRLYIVTTDGTLACMDASEASIAAANRGESRQVKEIKAPPPKQDVVPSTAVESTSDAGEGVIVECVKKGSRLRVQVVSDGYEKDWSVQFPKALRQEGAQYVVEEVLESSRGGFYRARGEIKKLD